MVTEEVVVLYHLILLFSHIEPAVMQASLIFELLHSVADDAVYDTIKKLQNRGSTLLHLILFSLIHHEPLIEVEAVQSFFRCI